MASRTREAISLGPMGNMQGTYQFMCLNSGKVIKRRQFKELPMPRPIINRVEQLRAQGTEGGLVFSDRHRIPFPWDDGNEEATMDLVPAQQGITEFPGVRIEEDDGAGDGVGGSNDDKEREQAAQECQP